MAHLSGDASLLRAFAEDRDVHQATAAEVFGDSRSMQVSADQRRSAKAINFGLIYGMSAFGLARQLGIGTRRCAKLRGSLFRALSGREALHGRDPRAGARGGIRGNRVRPAAVPARDPSRNQALRQYAERSAINAPMQGTAADIIKRAMIEVDALAAGHRAARGRLIMQVHDELVLEVADDAVRRIVGELRTIWRAPPNLPCRSRSM